MASNRILRFVVVFVITAAAMMLPAFSVSGQMPTRAPRYAITNARIVTMLAALEQWVEHGRAPDQIIASHSTNRVVDRTRPLCPYPEVAAYRGSGNINDASNFVCRQTDGGEQRPVKHE